MRIRDLQDTCFNRWLPEEKVEIDDNLNKVNRLLYIYSSFSAYPGFAILNGAAVLLMNFPQSIDPIEGLI
ncbi:MAG: hypothetical protein IPF68_00240 [Bacteroidales bacterium]|nr:hypothetical protein [Bacteroidales bacterium]